MSNLTTNAINYTPAGGIITVSTAVQQREDRGWITFTVSDTGMGISEEELSRVFERFFRGKASHASNTPGTGLGLAICKEIVERMAGQITVESQPGAGATFTVWLQPGSPPPAMTA
jgi:two-component system phosphate regulon sensor histidine kinase PhoR